MCVSGFSAGITLALFGGVQKNSMNRYKVPVRGDIHVVVVGNVMFIFPAWPIGISLMLLIMLLFSLLQVIQDLERANFSKLQRLFLHEEYMYVGIQQQELV
jgi:hypothetical protein